MPPPRRTRRTTNVQESTVSAAAADTRTQDDDSDYGTTEAQESTTAATTSTATAHSVDDDEAAKALKSFKKLLQFQYKDIQLDDDVTMDQLEEICREKYSDSYPGIDLDIVLSGKETMSQKLPERRIEYLLNHCHGWLVNRFIGMDILETNGDDNEPTHNHPYVLPSLAEGQAPDYDQLVNGLLNLKNELLVLLSPKLMKQTWNRGKYKKIVESGDTYKQKCPRAILERQIGYLTQLNIHFISRVNELETQSRDEELQRANDELKRTNQDLVNRVTELENQPHQGGGLTQSRDEELQRANDELERTNQNLRNRVTELENQPPQGVDFLAQANNELRQSELANLQSEVANLERELEKAKTGGAPATMNTTVEQGLRDRIAELEQTNAQLQIRVNERNEVKNELRNGLHNFITSFSNDTQAIIQREMRNGFASLREERPTTNLKPPPPASQPQPTSQISDKKQAAALGNNNYDSSSEEDDTDDSYVDGQASNVVNTARQPPQQRTFGASSAPNNPPPVAAAQPPRQRALGASNVPNDPSPVSECEIEGNQVFDKKQDAEAAQDYEDVVSHQRAVGASDIRNDIRNNPPPVAAPKPPQQLPGDVSPQPPLLHVQGYPVQEQEHSPTNYQQSEPPQQHAYPSTHPVTEQEHSPTNYQQLVPPQLPPYPPRPPFSHQMAYAPPHVYQHQPYETQQVHGQQMSHAGHHGGTYPPPQQPYFGPQAGPRPPPQQRFNPPGPHPNGGWNY